MQNMKEKKYAINCYNKLVSPRGGLMSRGASASGSPPTPQSKTSAHDQQLLQRQVVRVLVLHVLADPEDDRATKVSESSEPSTQPRTMTYLTPTRALLRTHSMPIPSAGIATPGTAYLRTKTVTPPAMPPARAAKPRKRTTRAFQATPEPL